MSYAGQPLKRLEDPRLLTGHGSFVVVSRDRYTARDTVDLVQVDS